MKALQNTSDRNYAIDLLKLFLCCGVVLYHINYTFYYGINEKPNIPYAFGFLFGIPFRGFFNGTFNVYLFCVLSGYFAAGKSITSFNELISICLKRYFAFFVPIFICNIFCFILYKNNLFYHKELSFLFNNSWLLNNYPDGITFLQTLKLSSYFSSILNQPLWMLSSLFLGNVLLYFSSYLKSKSNLSLLNYMILCLLLLGYYWVERVFCFQLIIVSVTYIGFIIFQVKDLFKNCNVKMSRLLFILSFFCFGNLEVSNDKILYTVYFLSSILLSLLFLAGFSRKFSPKTYAPIESFFCFHFI